jgi:hypothetical protein
VCCACVRECEEERGGGEEERGEEEEERRRTTTTRERERARERERKSEREREREREIRKLNLGYIIRETCGFPVSIIRQCCAYERQAGLPAAAAC